MVICHATTVIKPDARVRWLEILEDLVPPSRADSGCRRYDVSEAMEHPNTFIFVEEWASIDDFNAHCNTPHVGRFFDELAGVVAEPPVGTISDVSSTITLDEALAAAGSGW